MARELRLTLAKILALLAPPAPDGEALSAARRAAAMQAASGLSWEQLLGVSTPSAPPPPQEQPPDPPIAWKGRQFAPPHGGRWLLTVLHLLQPNPRTFELPVGDQLWLRTLPGKIAKRGIMPYEAANIVMIWNDAHLRHTARQGAQA